MKPGAYAPEQLCDRRSLRERRRAPLLAAVCATSFAYEGWIIATSINAELKDAKRNLPKALIIGGIIIIVTYISYYVGVAGGATVDVLMNDGATTAFTNIFGGVLGNILNLFIAISCIGTDERPDARLLPRHVLRSPRAMSGRSPSSSGR